MTSLKALWVMAAWILVPWVTQREPPPLADPGTHEGDSPPA